MKLSICIIHYNSIEYTIQVLNCIINSSLRKEVYEILVLDNGSSKILVDCIDFNYPKNLHIYRFDETVGFAAANNYLFSKSSADYLLMMNNDVIFDKSLLFKSIEFMENNANASAMTCKILNNDYSIQHPCYTNSHGLISEISTLLAFAKINYFLKVFISKMSNEKNSIPELVKVKHACGCFILFRHSLIRSLHYLDEKFIFGLEDLDICNRLIKSFKDYDIYSVNSIELIHFGGGSREKFNLKLFSMIMQSYSHYYFKYYGCTGLYVVYFFKWLNSFFHFLFLFVKKIFSLNYNSYFYCYHKNIILLKFFTFRG